MTDYKDIRKMYTNAAMRDRVAVAIAVAADKIRTEKDSDGGFARDPKARARRVAWAKAVLGKTETQVNRFWQAILASNHKKDITEIAGWTDEAVQTEVESLVDFFSDAAL